MQIFANLLLLSAAFLTLPSLSPAIERVTAVYTSIAAAYAPFWVAKDTGIFDKYGLDTKLVYMRGTIPTIAALATVTSNSSSPALRPLSTMPAEAAT